MITRNVRRFFTSFVQMNDVNNIVCCPFTFAYGLWELKQFDYCMFDIIVVDDSKVEGLIGFDDTLNLYVA